MKKALPEAKRIFRRIILTFLLAIILPSALLGYFGIYAIESESDVLKGGVRENHMAVAKFVYAQLKEEILVRESKVRRDVNLFLPVQYERYEVFKVMDRLRLVHKLVKESFLLTEEGRLLYPLEIAAEGTTSGKLARIPSTIPQSEFQKHIELEQIYNEGRKLEFSSGSHKLAIEQYEKVAQNKLNDQLAAEARYAIGRCYSKAGNHEKAISNYEKLFSVTPSLRLISGLPISLEAHFAASRDYIYLDIIDKAVEILLESYATLLDYGYPVSLDEFHEISSRIRGALDALELDGKLSVSNSADYANFQGLEELRISQDRLAGTIRGVFLPHLLDAFIKPAQIPQTGRHINADIGGEKMTVMFFFPLNVGSVGGQSVRYLYGCVLNTEYLREISSELVAGGRFEEGLVVSVMSNEQVMAISPGAPEGFSKSVGSYKSILSAKLPFSEILPHWDISVYYLNMGKLDQWIGRRLLSHVVTVILLIVVIFVGVFLSLKGISKEIELAKIKSDFVSNVSHELKTPLTSIRMFAEMLKSGRVKSDAKRQEYYDIMTAESERLSRLINNVLDFARVQEGRKKYNFKRLDVKELIREIEQIALPYIVQQGFKVNVETSDEDLFVMGDKDSLGQVLLNILNNAVKYSGDTKEIILNAHADESNVFIDIEDSGVGIKQDDIPKIFTKFYRVDDRPGYQSAGTGIGLTLAKQIIEAHDGRIEVKSEVGKGSIFSVIIPLAPEQKPERSPVS